MTEQKAAQPNVQLVGIEEINPAKYNPRIDLQPDDPDYKKIERSIQEFGYVDPLIWNKHNKVLISGHQRLKILRARGFTHIGVSVVDIKDERREKAMNMAMNKVSGNWDFAMLSSMLSAMEPDMRAIAGFEEAEIRRMIGDEPAPVGAEDLSSIALEEARLKCPKCGFEYEDTAKK